MIDKIKRSDFHSLIDHPGSGALLGISSNKVLLVKVQRADFPFETFEIPGGVCEPNETHEQAARREFLEETGYQVGYTSHLQTITPSVGYSNEMISIFYGAVTEKVGEAEHEILWATKSDINELIAKGRIVDAQSLAALSLWLISNFRSDLPKVLFLCTGNYYRSRFCEIYFNHLINNKAIKADSKGLLAWRKINEGMLSIHTLNYLNQLSLDPSSMKFPEQIEARHFVSGVKIIAMDELEHRPMMEKDFPQYVDRIEYWQVHDIDFTEPAEALPILKEKVEVLVKQLASTGLV